ncbi:hypothetical protein OFC58_30035, partial [Escherichia coli]|nr:hypothetical protein [Escherichia coli]
CAAWCPPNRAGFSRACRVTHCRGHPARSRTAARAAHSRAVAANMDVPPVLARCAPLLRRAEEMDRAGTF